MKTLLGHPLFTAVVGGIAGSIFTWLTVSNAPPTVSLVPASIAVDAAESVTFDGQGSSDTDGEIKSFEWTVGGSTYNETNIASCSDGKTNAQITCRFAIPGSHIVSLAVVDNDGGISIQSANVRVKMPGGYIGIVLQYGVENKDENLQNAFNYGVDWIEIQSLLKGKPIVLYDPIIQEPVFATRFTRSINKAAEYAKQSNNTKGLKVLARLPNKAKEKLIIDLSKIGVDVTFISIGAGEVYTALERGLTDSSFVLLNEPSALSEYYK